MRFEKSSIWLRISIQGWRESDLEMGVRDLGKKKKKKPNRTSWLQLRLGNLFGSALWWLNLAGFAHNFGNFQGDDFRGGFWILERFEWVGFFVSLDRNGPTLLLIYIKDDFHVSPFNLKYYILLLQIWVCFQNGQTICFHHHVRVREIKEKS